MSGRSGRWCLLHIVLEDYWFDRFVYLIRKAYIRLMSNFKALSEAFTENIPGYRHLHKATKAIFFFGVPHKGLRIDELEKMAEGVPAAKQTLIKDLHHGSTVLADENRRIQKVLEGKKIFSFYERRNTPTIRPSSVSINKPVVKADTDKCRTPGTMSDPAQTTRW